MPKYRNKIDNAVITDIGYEKYLVDVFDDMFEAFGQGGQASSGGRVLSIDQVCPKCF